VLGVVCVRKRLKCQHADWSSNGASHHSSKAYKDRSKGATIALSIIRSADDVPRHVGRLFKPEVLSSLLRFESRRLHNAGSPITVALH
jgi:hypothetical protein